MIRRELKPNLGDSVRYLGSCQYRGKVFIYRGGGFRWTAEGDTDPVHGECECELVGAPRKKVLYLAHPVSGDMLGNALRAVQWVKFFHTNHPYVIVIAPWVAEVLGFLGTDALPEGSTAPGAFDRVLPDDEEIVRHCDGVVGVGGRLSPGMVRERDAALAAGKSWTDMTRYARPEDVPADFFLDPESL